MWGQYHVIVISMGNESFDALLARKVEEGRKSRNEDAAPVITSVPNARFSPEEGKFAEALYARLAAQEKDLIGKGSFDAMLWVGQIEAELDKMSEWKNKFITAEDPRDKVFERSIYYVMHNGATLRLKRVNNAVTILGKGDTMVQPFSHGTMYKDDKGVLHGEPQMGLSPVEIWGDAKNPDKIHYGYKITEVRRF
jgi:hypothetical protein